MNHAGDRPLHEEATASPTQRLDKWLWFARVAKTRTLASRLVSDGKVRINGTKADKPSQNVRPGDVLTISVHRRVRVLEIRDIGERRGPATEAAGLFNDLTPPDPVPAPGRGVSDLGGRGQRPVGSGRPTKKERRQLDQLRGDDKL